MFDRKFIDLIEIYNYMNNYTKRVLGNFRMSQSAVRRTAHTHNIKNAVNDLGDIIKGQTTTEIMNNKEIVKFIKYYGSD